MKFSLSWLKAHLDSDASLSEITEKLTAIGLEIEGVENPADALKPFRVAKVIEALPHPDADKLQLLKVDDGSEKPWQVVCGAPNAKTGMIGVFGPPGTYIPGSDFTLKAANIRGVESCGMMCSERELELGDDHDGIIELPADAADAVGQSYADYADIDDPVMDVAITPNRQDCMGVRGIARDLAAAGLGKLKPLKTASGAGSFACPTEIRTDDPGGCPAFYGRVIKGVKNGKSPGWMQARLKSAGQKPISAIVDITNYVMLDHGRPSHAYDLAKLSGAVVARKAKDGESVTALNEKEYTLTSDMTVIADDARVHDIAGIMGGEHSGCSDDTVDVLLEVAYFTPEHIARTGQALMLTSDARMRFERGVDPAFLDDAIELITGYILEICGGEASQVTRAGKPPLNVATISYDTGHCLRLGGLDVAADKQKAILESLGFSVDDDWNVTVPTWRRDVEGGADLVEEIVRIVGLDDVPSTPLPRADGVAKPTATPVQQLERKLRRTAASCGLNEAINWAFLPEKEAAAFGGGDRTLANPISEDMKVMRPSMLPGLLSAARRNSDRGAASIRLFEVGRRYFKAADGSSDERLTLGIVMTGDKRQRGWTSGKATKFDAHDAKREVIALLNAAGVNTERLMVMGDAGEHYHPGQSATLRQGPKNVLASFGMLHPATAKAFDLDGTVAAAEIYLDAIPAKKAPKKSGNNFMRPTYTPPALQAVTRDFAFVVPEELPAADLASAIRGSDKKNITAARIFDRFAGGNMPEGKISLAVEVTMQPAEKSYTDEELKAISDKVIAAATKLGAELRG
ncbi:MAG: phenylalanine--tRNA ligase subunit beta [Sphingorhabdus sp.]